MISTTESARILEVNLGAVTEALWAESPELRKRVGREWTKMHYQKHMKNRVRKFIKEKIKILDQLMNAGEHSLLILAGHPTMTCQMRDDLLKRLLAKLVDVVPASVKTPVSDVVKATLASFIAREEKESQAIADTLSHQVHTGGLAVTGNAASFQALNRGQVDTLVLL